MEQAAAVPLDGASDRRSVGLLRFVCQGDHPQTWRRTSKFAYCFFAQDCLCAFPAVGWRSFAAAVAAKAACRASWALHQAFVHVWAARTAALLVRELCAAAPGLRAPKIVAVRCWCWSIGGGCGGQTELSRRGRSRVVGGCLRSRFESVGRGVSGLGLCALRRSAMWGGRV